MKLDKPDDADADFYDDDILLRLRGDWHIGSTTYKEGSLLTAKLEEFVSGHRHFQVLFEPTPRSSLSGYTGTKNMLITNALTDVKSQLTVFKRANASAPWVGIPFEESVRTIRVAPFEPSTSDDAWLWLEDFTVPTSLELWNVARGTRESMKKTPSFFETNDIDVAQHFSTSKDGTKIPYFEVSKRGRTPSSPTLIEAYGGFGTSVLPSYRDDVGVAWLDRGGTYILANVRGGGEYGPAWHQAAVKHNRQNAYDDLISVAEDVIKRGVASTKTLGIMGESNGGLLSSVMLTQRPDLWAAVVSKVPLTDMQRFHKLLAGASWMNEFGDPDNADDWAALQKFSPFHNIKTGVSYPSVFFTASTKDDRVHPGHARKMVAKLEAFGHTPLYYENLEGGHGGAADIAQGTYLDALVYTFLWTRLNSTP